MSVTRERMNLKIYIVLVYNIVFTVNGQFVLDTLFMDIWGIIISDAYFKQQERRHNEPIL